MSTAYTKAGTMPTDPYEAAFAEVDAKMTTRADPYEQAFAEVDAGINATTRGFTLTPDQAKIRDSFEPRIGRASTSIGYQANRPRPQDPGFIVPRGLPTAADALTANHGTLIADDVGPRQRPGQTVGTGWLQTTATDRPGQTVRRAAPQLTQEGAIENAGQTVDALTADRLTKMAALVTPEQLAEFQQFAVSKGGDVQHLSEQQQRQAYVQRALADGQDYMQPGRTVQGLEALKNNTLIGLANFLPPGPPGSFLRDWKEQAKGIDPGTGIGGFAGDIVGGVAPSAAAILSGAGLPATAVTLYLYGRAAYEETYRRTGNHQQALTDAMTTAGTEWVGLDKIMGPLGRTARSAIGNAATKTLGPIGSRVAGAVIRGGTVEAAENVAQSAAQETSAAAFGEKTVGQAATDFAEGLPGQVVTGFIGGGILEGPARAGELLRTVPRARNLGAASKPQVSRTDASTPQGPAPTPPAPPTPPQTPRTLNELSNEELTRLSEMNGVKPAKNRVTMIGRLREFGADPADLGPTPAANPPATPESSTNVEPARAEFNQTGENENAPTSLPDPARRVLGILGGETAPGQAETTTTGEEQPTVLVDPRWEATIGTGKARAVEALAGITDAPVSFVARDGSILAGNNGRTQTEGDTPRVYLAETFAPESIQNDGLDREIGDGLMNVDQAVRGRAVQLERARREAMRADPVTATGMHEAVHAIAERSPAIVDAVAAALPDEVEAARTLHLARLRAYANRNTSLRGLAERLEAQHTEAAGGGGRSQLTDEAVATLMESMATGRGLASLYRTARNATALDRIINAIMRVLDATGVTSTTGRELRKFVRNAAAVRGRAGTQTTSQTTASGTAAAGSSTVEPAELRPAREAVPAQRYNRRTEEEKGEGFKVFSRGALNARLAELNTDEGIDAGAEMDRIQAQTGEPVSFSFSGPLPSELKTALEGKFHLRRYFSANQKRGSANGEDTMSRIGVDEMVRLAEMMHAEGNTGRQKKAAARPDQPEAYLAAWMLDNQPAGRQPKLRVMAPDEIPVGSTWTLYGEEMRVEDGDDASGGRRKLVGMREPITIDDLREVPMDPGSFERGDGATASPEPTPPAVGAGEAVDIQGDELAGLGTMSPAATRSEPTNEDDAPFSPADGRYAEGMRRNPWRYEGQPLTEEFVNSLSNTQVRRTLQKLGYKAANNPDHNRSDLLAIGRGAKVEQRFGSNASTMEQTIAEWQSQDEARRQLLSDIKQRPGWTLEYTSDSGSVYARHGASGELIRISDHSVPETIFRDMSKMPWTREILLRTFKTAPEEFANEAAAVEKDYAESKSDETPDMPGSQSSVTEPSPKAGAIDPSVQRGDQRGNPPGTERFSPADKKRDVVGQTGLFGSQAGREVGPSGGQQARLFDTAQPEKAKPAAYEAEYTASRAAGDAEAAKDRETGRLFSPADKHPAQAMEDVIEKRLGRGALDRIVADNVVGPVLNTAKKTAQAAATAVLGKTRMEAAMQAVNRVVAMGVPEHSIPTEAMAAIKEAQNVRSVGQQAAEDLLSVLSGKSDRSRLLGVTVEAKDRTPDIHARMFRFLDGKATADELPGTMKELGQKAKAFMDSLRQQMLRQGLMSQETFDRYKGRYIPYMYMDHERARGGVAAPLARFLFSTGLRKPRLSDKFLILKDGKPMDAKGKVLNAPGSNTPGFPSAEARDEFLERLIDQEWLKAVNAGQYLQGQRVTLHALRSGSDKALPEAKRLAIENLREGIAKRYSTRDPMGETDYARMGRIEDPAFLVANAVNSASNDLAMASLFAKLDSRLEWVSDQPAADEFGDFVQMPNTPRMGRLAGKYVQKGIAGAIMAQARDMDHQLLQLMDQALTAWKWGKTVANPGTHVRNVIGNTYFASLAGNGVEDPRSWRHYARALGIVLGNVDDATYREISEAGLLDSGFTREDLTNRFSELDRARLLKGFDEATPPGKITAALAAAGGLLGEGAKKTVGGMTWAYQAEDDLFKIAAYLRARSEGATPKQAEKHVRTWFPDYSNIMDFGGNRLIKRILPFWSFTREGARITLTGLARKPVTTLAWSSIPLALSYASAGLLGLDDDERERIFGGMRGTVSGQPVFSILLPWRDDQGRLMQYDLTNTIPLAGLPLLGARQDPIEEKKGWASSMLNQILTSNPFMNLAIANASGRDPYFDRAFLQSEMSAGEQWGERARYMARTLLPPILGRDVLNLIAPSATGAAPSVFDPGGVERGTLKRRSPEQFLLRSLAGIDIRTADIPLREMIDEYKKAKKLPSSPTLDDNTERGRARGRLYQAILDEDAGRVGRELARLREAGAPIATAKQLEEFIDDRNPLRSLRKDDRAAFVRSLPDELRRTVIGTMREYEAVKRKAGKIVTAGYAEAKRQGWIGAAEKK